MALVSLSFCYRHQPPDFWPFKITECWFINFLAVENLMDLLDIAKTFLPLKGPTHQTKPMPAISIISSANIVQIKWRIFCNLLVMSYLGIIGVEGNSEIPAIWRIYNR